MPKAATFFRLDEVRTVERAIANLEQRGQRDTETNQLNEALLIAEVSAIMSFDPVVERQLKAKRMVKDRERPRKTPQIGSVWLPGLDAAPYEPQQLIPDNQGNTVERDLARSSTLEAALARSADHLAKTHKAHTRKVVETEEHAKWESEQLLAGRSPNETGFGNFVRENGYWQPDPVDDDEGDED